MKTRRGASRIGLDIGATAVRAVQLAFDGRRWTVRHKAEAPRRRTREAEPASLKKGQEPSHPVPPGAASSLGAEIEMCLAQAPFRGKRAAVGLSAPDIELLTLDLPPRGEQSLADFEQIVRIEVQRLATRNQSPLEIACWSLPKGTGRSPTAIGVAAPGDLVREMADVCHAAGADCETIDASACALVRAALVMIGPREGQLWGVLDLGERQTRLAVCLGDTPVLVRSLGDGGRGWTRRLAEELKISEDAAEVHKCDVGIEPSTRGVRRTGSADPQLIAHPDGAARKELGAILFGALRGSLGRLVTEIERSYSYVLSCYPAAKPLDLLMTGGGASMRGLMGFLGESLGIGVRSLGEGGSAEECRLSFGHASGGAASCDRFSTAIGLALEGCTR
ncbi:MAG: hypothetical protein IT449_08330 [Phycisphaerales bacterium]|nr:hypothetical protein [Phycisphaerales bacterium]